MHFCSMSEKMETIHLRDALRLMDESMKPNGDTVPFDIAFYRFNDSRPIANGTVARYTNCIKAVLRQNMVKNMQRGIQVLDSGEIKSVHIWLIKEFNGQRVRW